VAAFQRRPPMVSTELRRIPTRGEADSLLGVAGVILARDDPGTSPSLPEKALRKSPRHQAPKSPTRFYEDPETSEISLLRHRHMILELKVVFGANFFIGQC
jgi:hypothetical protein